MIKIASAMGEPNEAAKARARCVLWLCGQCRGGTDCRCVPQPPPKPVQRPTG